ncbi:hypothetical protein LWI28_023953 [Acer negundo]|uniref:Uncharacterized protein n=1 Tax=Acer negundo TaxID=4023 RepID=A0AAD5JK11_ACENE|nr:hypothetical protein LWI28_023953 [Acer negundo]
MNAYIPEASTCGVTEAALAALSLKRNSSKLYQIKLLYCACRMKSYFVHGILTVAELAESKLIDPQFADAVDMSDVQDEFSAVITKASVTLVLGLETKFDAEMAAMTRVP